VSDATASNTDIPQLLSPRGQFARIDRCVWKSVTLADTEANGLHMQDTRIENSDLANINLTGCSLERVEFLSTRLTGATCAEARFKSLLFRECKLDFAFLRMTRLQQCVFEQCNLTDADFYGADLSGAPSSANAISAGPTSHKPNSPAPTSADAGWTAFAAHPPPWPVSSSARIRLPCS
jgi:uncharacterized protein YjbI with pentapeptide repeats